MSQNDKLLKYFYFVTVGIVILGGILLINDGEFDIYGAWNIAGFIVGAYLVNKLK